MRSIHLVRSVFALLLVAFTVPLCCAQTYTVLYSFTGGSDGASPMSRLVLDSAGNLYGTTLGMNSYPYQRTTGTTAGSIFKISSSGEFTLLYNFGAGGVNGTSPSGGLVRDSAGNLYGATKGGGAGTDSACFAGDFRFPTDGCGEIFKLDASGNFSVIYSFPGTSDCWRGCLPLAPLTLDSKGNLYGTTYLGGSRDCDTFRLNNLGGILNSECGVVFKLDPTGKQTVLHRFGNAIKEGDFPNPGLYLDGEGNLYGTTFGGGINGRGANGDGGAGTIYKLDQSGNQTVLFYFQRGVNDENPNGSLVRDNQGNFYGTSQGFEAGSFKFSSDGTLSQLPNLDSITADGFTIDGAGNLYAAAFGGGNSGPSCGYFGNNSCGNILELDTAGNVITLYDFTGAADGDEPYAGLVMDSLGNLYGTTAYGGTVNSACPVGCGVVFKITP